jgi:hypothetical protein
MNIGEFFKIWLSFDGRISRREYWLKYIFLISVFLIPVYCFAYFAATKPRSRAPCRLFHPADREDAYARGGLDGLPVRVGHVHRKYANNGIFAAVTTAESRPSFYP